MSLSKADFADAAGGSSHFKANVRKAAAEKESIRNARQFREATAAKAQQVLAAKAMEQGGVGKHRSNTWSGNAKVLTALF
jgi:hypothetical protein